jgi:AcrR family transcriptional regulator
MMQEPDGGELASHPTKEGKYSSRAIVERRQRILKETRKLIADNGLQGFSIRELCRRADVAQRTLYNAFHSKDRLIALAIGEAYDYVNSHVRYRTSPETLEGILDRTIAVNLRNRGARNYTRTVTSLYFASDVSEDIWRVLQHIVFQNLMQWLKRVEADGELRPATDVTQLGATFASMEYGIINDWAQERISDEEFLPRLVKGILYLTIGATTGSVRKSAQAYLEEIERSGELPKFPLAVWRPRSDMSEFS